MWGMCWRYGMVLMEVIPPTSLMMPLILSLVHISPVLPTTPIALVQVFYVVIVVAPSVAAIGAILTRRRIFGEPVSSSGYISRPAKVTVVVLAVWTVFPVWVAVIAPSMG